MPEQRPSYHRFHVWPSEIVHGKSFQRQFLERMLILECIWLSFPNYPIGCIHQRLFLLSFPLEMRIITDIWIRFRDIKTFWVCELVLMFWYTAAIVLSRGILSFCKGISSGYLYSHIQIMTFCLIIHSEALENILRIDEFCILGGIYHTSPWTLNKIKITHASTTPWICQLQYAFAKLIDYYCVYERNIKKGIFPPKWLRLKVWL